MVENSELEIIPNEDVVNPFTLPDAERRIYFARYMTIAFKPGVRFRKGLKIQERNVYNGNELGTFITGGFLGIGAVIEDDGGLRYILTPQGWKDRTNLDGQAMDIVSDFEVLGTTWTLQSHSTVFDPKSSR